MIDSYVTPQAIAALRRSEGSAPDSDDRSAKIDQSLALARQIQWNQVQYAFFTRSPFAFKVDILPPNDPPLRHPVGLEFDWSGDWRLVHIALPEDIFDSNDKSSSRPSANSALPQPAKQASAAESARNDQPALIDVSLRSKRFKAADYKANDFEAAIIFELSIANKSEKAIRAFDGALTFTDLLDNKVFSSRLAINDPNRGRIEHELDRTHQIQSVHGRS